MDPVIVIPDGITAIVDISIRRETNEGVGRDRVFFPVQINPGFPLDKQNKVVWNSALMLDITWFWVVGIMPAAVDVYHDDISCKKQNMSVISIVRYCICRVN